VRTISQMQDDRAAQRFRLRAGAKLRRAFQVTALVAAFGLAAGLLAHLAVGAIAKAAHDAVAAQDQPLKW
jgi:hypothetical protein